MGAGSDILIGVPGPAGTGLDQLTGDVTAGPGVGSQVAVLQDSANVQAVIAANAINQLTGDITAGPGGGSEAATLVLTPNVQDLIDDEIENLAVLVNAPAGGDLGGTYPNPDVEAIDGVVLSPFPPSPSMALIATGPAAAAWSLPPGQFVNEVGALLDGATGLVAVATPVAAATSVWMEAWFVMPPVSVNGVIVSNGSETGLMGYCLGVSNGHHTGGAGDFLTITYPSVAELSTNARVSPGLHHAVLVLDAGGNTTTYLDGVSVYTNNVNLPLAATGGKFQLGNGFANNYPWPSVIAHGALGTGALSAARVLAHYNALYANYAATVKADAPSVWWPLDDGVGSTSVRDRSGNGNPGAVTGTITFYRKAPLASHTTTAAFGALVVGTPKLNTLGYDVLLNVTVNLTAATTAVISVGVGPTATPTVDPITPALSVTGDVSFNVLVPDGHWISVTATGAVATVGSCTVQACAVSTT